jgi:hypothetical protein
LKVRISDNFYRFLVFNFFLVFHFHLASLSRLDSPSVSDIEFFPILTELLPLLMPKLFFSMLKFLQSLFRPNNVNGLDDSISTKVSVLFRIRTRESDLCQDSNQFVGRLLGEDRQPGYDVHLNQWLAAGISVNAESVFWFISSRLISGSTAAIL